MRAVLRMFKFAFQSILRNFWLSFVTTSVLVLTLITVNALVFLNYLGDAAVKSIEEQVQVEVYLTPEVSEEIQTSMFGYLSSLEQVRSVATISADEALLNFKERHADNPEVLAALEEVGGNPFGPAFRISANNPEDFEFILTALDSPEYAPSIKEKDFSDYAQEIDLLTSFTEKVRLGGFVVAGFFALIAILIVFNTIRVAIYVHRDEIAVMKLVGAHDWFVRGPFLLEAFFYSLAATTIMAVLIASSMNALEPGVKRFFTGIDVSMVDFYTQHGLLLFGTQLLGLTLLSVITTTFAIRKYLRV